MLVGRTPGLEELNQLLAGSVVIPFTVAAHDLDQLVERLLPAVISVQSNGEVESRLMIERVGGNLLFQFRDRTKMRGLFGDLKGSAGRGDRRIIALGLRHLRENLFSLLDAPGLQIGSCETCERVRIGRIAGQDLGIQIRGRGGVASPSAASAALSSSFSSDPISCLVRRSRNAITWLSGRAPIKPSTGCPLVKAKTAGMDWIPS